MTYRFVQERPDYQDFASGNVFYSLSGHTAFPIRLTSEIFQRCLELRSRDRQQGACHVYDPCCGTGYLLATLAFLHWTDVYTVVGSDADPAVVTVASRNLNLLTLEGLDQRMQQIESLITQFDKPSHKAALQSVQRLKDGLVERIVNHTIATRTFNANILVDDVANHFSAPIDVVISDIPYGNRSSWMGLPLEAPSEPTWYMLQSLLKVISSHTLVAIACNKQQKILAHVQVEW